MDTLKSKQQRASCKRFAIVHEENSFIMSVILCLFSALSRRVGALQISIIIIISQWIIYDRIREATE